MIDNWPWFLGLLLITFLLRQFRMFVLARKALREKAAVAPPSTPAELAPPPSPAGPKV